MLERDSRRLGNLITEEEMYDLIDYKNEKEDSYKNQEIKNRTDKYLVLTDIRNKALENQKDINKYDRERISNITQSRNEEKLRRDKEDAFTNYVKSEENAGNIDKTQKGTDYHDSEDFIFEYMSIKNKNKDKGDENI